ncbi:uncharacterized protein SCHCODRAFT_02697606 [Schizophyllum commune H4-8]|nr:uncharacterized protein SCHCODRAFT_02697606 [Schizophyllum commune H4-8]KAI5896124.1 hypothetical protein SCHCODRAFT_02697606 [Schizophyllum commune H4-8]
MAKYLPRHLRQNAPPPSTFTSDEINAGLDLVTQNHTLRARADDRLAAIFDYERAVSFIKGTTRAQISCHSNLHFLPPKDQFDVEEYPLFQTADLGGRTNSLEFVALVRVVDVEIREPHSPELLKLLKAKFGDGARDPVAWKKSLDMPWAVVTLEKVEGGKNPMH